MNCDEAGTLVTPYADGEISGLRRRSVEKHLRACALCAASHQDVLALRARLRAEVPTFKAPPQLRARVRSLLAATGAAAPAGPRLLRDHWRWLARGALAGCTATVLAWVAASAVIDWRSNQDIAAEAVAAHTRATLSDHLIQVASSDQHTVKPWLSARLDYSPPVQDLASEGFALSGGRLDTLDKRQVATLVYRYRQHTIDVFVRPESARAPSEPRTVRGFNVAHATGSGMDWLAVSDVSPDVLTAFVQRLARAEVSQ
ncbi:MAG TPA: zf-HC2 domain-containing protein [Burkholderiaceae bacterium]|nr:zf-HC2 domain-containing protein [Burkholderiaceae bacterium]